jgi:CRISPR/Cas system CSM-associated protein Csm4 (group 5 of RAMP superfamily)
MIIGLTGYAQSGKDTLANLLVENYGYTRVAFADKIRDFLYEMNPMVDTVAFEPIFLKERVDRDGWEVAKQNPHIRRALQNAGVAARKTFGEGFWVHEAMKSMLEDPRPDMNYVITDVRFLNEADMIRANKGQMWRVKRNGVEAVNAHISESQLDGYPVDQIFTNNGSIDDLKELLNKRLAG